MGGYKDGSCHLQQRVVDCLVTTIPDTSMGFKIQVHMRTVSSALLLHEIYPSPI